jgi:hypothetical protein
MGYTTKADLDYSSSRRILKSSIGHVRVVQRELGQGMMNVRHVLKVLHVNDTPVAHEFFADDQDSGKLLLRCFVRRSSQDKKWSALVLKPLGTRHRRWPECGLDLLRSCLDEIINLLQ